jgi:lysyl-tRNA synthetase class II
MSFQNFRNEGMDRTHNPNLLRWKYVAYKRLQRWMMGAEELLEYVCGCGKWKFRYYNWRTQISFKALYTRDHDESSIKAFYWIFLEERNRTLMLQEAWECVDLTMGKGKLIDEVLALNAKEIIFNTLLIIKGDVAFM